MSCCTDCSNPLQHYDNTPIIHSLLWSLGVVTAEDVHTKYYVYLQCIILVFCITLMMNLNSLKGLFLCQCRTICVASWVPKLLLTFMELVQPAQWLPSASHPALSTSSQQPETTSAFICVTCSSGPVGNGWCFFFLPDSASIQILML